MKRRNAVAALLGLPGVMMGTALAQKAATPKPQNSLALGEPYVRELLALMATSKNGKISKREFMRFMEAEFARLDKENIGELDPIALTQLRSESRRFAEAGK